MSATPYPMPPRPRASQPDRRTLLAAEKPTENLRRHGRHRVALGFPNAYRVGMSNLGFQWVYRLLNREDEIACERFFQEVGRGAETPRTLETRTPIAAFPLVALSISWEMDYPNFLTLLRLAGIPPREERTETDPIVLVGGDCARINPAPLSPWVDVFAMGDGEKLVPEVGEIVRLAGARATRLERFAARHGFYVPALHGERAEAAHEGKVVVQQFRGADGPAREPPHTTLLTPHTELADKLLIEIARGCSEMCRFCWSAYAMAPQVRIGADRILEVAARNRRLTSRAGLIATAVGDHPEILPILKGLRDLDFHIALSSIKIDAVTEELLALLVGQGGRSLAIAPEAGNERLRRAMNKKVTDEMLREKVRLIGAAGITNLKLYLQVGLPGETDPDVEDIVRLVEELRGILLAEGRKRGRLCTLSPSVNAFIPKPQTPFENESLEDPGELTRKLALLESAFSKMHNVTYRKMAVVEAVWEAYLAKMGPESRPILERAAEGVPVRRLIRDHEETMRSVIGKRGDEAGARPRGAFDLGARTASPWGFIAKR